MAPKKNATLRVASAEDEEEGSHVRPLPISSSLHNKSPVPNESVVEASHNNTKKTVVKRKKIIKKKAGAVKSNEDEHPQSVPHHDRHYHEEEEEERSPKGVRETVMRLHTDDDEGGNERKKQPKEEQKQQKQKKEEGEEEEGGSSSSNTTHRVRAPGKGEPDLTSLTEDVFTTEEFVFKVVVVGNFHVGKSCLIQRLQQAARSTSLDSVSTLSEGDPSEARFCQLCIQTPLSSTKPTIGIEFHPCTVEHVLPHVTVRLQLWDTAGLERYATLPAVTFRGVSLVLCVFDATDVQSLKAVMKRFIPQVAVGLPDADVERVFVVANKLDLIDDPLPQGAANGDDDAAAAPAAAAAAAGRSAAQLQRRRHRYCMAHPDAAFCDIVEEEEEDEEEEEEDEEDEEDDEEEEGENKKTKSSQRKRGIVDRHPLFEQSSADQVQGGVHQEQVEEEVLSVFPHIHYAEVSAFDGRGIATLLKQICHTLLEQEGVPVPPLRSSYSPLSSYSALPKTTSVDVAEEKTGPTMDKKKRNVDPDQEHRVEGGSPQGISSTTPKRKGTVKAEARARLDAGGPQDGGVVHHNNSNPTSTSEEHKNPGSAAVVKGAGGQQWQSNGMGGGGAATAMPLFQIPPTDLDGLTMDDPFVFSPKEDKDEGTLVGMARKAAAAAKQQRRSRQPQNATVVDDDDHDDDDDGDGEDLYNDILSETEEVLGDGTRVDAILYGAKRANAERRRQRGHQEGGEGGMFPDENGGGRDEEAAGAGGAAEPEDDTAVDEKEVKLHFQDEIREKFADIEQRAEERKRQGAEEKEMKKKAGQKPPSVDIAERYLRERAEYEAKKKEKKKKGCAC